MKYPRTILWLITLYSWGFDVALPRCWLTVSYRGYAYVSPDATPDAAWFFLWGNLK